MTGHDEPEYVNIYNDQQREAFGRFGHLLLYGGGLIAAGMHVEIGHSLGQMIGL